MTRTELYSKYIEEYVEMSNSELAELIKHQERLDVGVSTIARALRKIRKESREYEDAPILKCKYQYVEDDNMVIFNISGQTRVRSGNVVDKWYQTYTSGEVTIARLANIFNEDQHEMRAMLAALNLTKTSIGRAPWVIAHGDIEEVARDTVRQITATQKRIFHQKQREAMEAEFAKLASEAARREEFFSLVGMYSDKVPYREPQINRYDHLLNGEISLNLVSILSDWHVGAKGVDMIRGEPYNSDIRRRRLAQLKEEMSKYRARTRANFGHIYGFVLGDILDDPMASIFKGQSAQQDLQGARQVLEAVRSLTDHILFHYHLFGTKMTWHLVRGNHGYEFEDVLYLWLKENLSNYEDIEIIPTTSRYAITHDPFSDTQIIGLHGDGKIDPNGISLMVECGAANRLILHGHLHHLEVEEIARGYRVMCPSIVGGNAYSQSLNFDAKAGQVMVELCDDGPRPAIYLPLR